MSLIGKIGVNTHYTRSINLERDANSIEVVRAYIPTSRALRTLTKVSEAFHEQQAPRAWSLVGPYGSGKSSFSVFLSHLLSGPNEATSCEARNILTKVNDSLGEQFTEETKTEGYLKVLITGAPEPLGKRIVKGMCDAAANYWKGSKGKNPKILIQLKDTLTQEAISTTEIVSLMKSLQEQLEKKGCSGIMLIIDELGKFLEYEARHYGANDIYLLQALAEHACKGSKVNLFLFVLLHQSFEQYAKGLGESLKSEWSKVQGRFEEVPFLESAEQVLRVVSAAFNHNLNSKEGITLSKITDEIITILEGQNALPGALNHSEARELFSGCYPLHPVSALLLPLLCQKVAQNERTLFSYLGSHEDFGLHDMLVKLQCLGDFVLPHHIYDYFITNQPAVMGDYLTHRRWAEVVTAIERLGDVDEDTVNLLKTIGILNIIGGKGGFKASSSILESCFKTKVLFEKAIETLTSQSVITYRHFSGEYRVWQGSDFDLEAAVQEELNNLGNFSLADELNSAKSMLPIVARKYTIKNGTLRYFVPVFVDAQNYKSLPTEGEEARIIFYLASAQDDEALFKKAAINYYSKLDIVVLCLSGMQLREAMSETLSLSRVLSNRQELNADPVAKKEFDDRYTASEQSADSLLQNLVDRPEESEWYHSNKKLVIRNKRQLQHSLSSALESVYTKSPRIYNELVNRDKPSAQANAARNKLLVAMLENAKEKDLGIEKFPAEKAIYRALLLATKVHQPSEELNGWGFSQPTTFENNDHSNIRHVWARIDKFLDSTEKEAKSFADLNAELIAPPYGVKAGVLPILYVAVYIVYQHELALYEKRRYAPYFTKEMLEQFVKRPDEFSFQRFRISGMRASIFKQYSQVIHGDSEERTLLQLAKPLANFMGGLPQYTQKTRRGLSKQAIDIRAAFNLAKSPEQLLFSALPKALGFDQAALDGDENKCEEFSGKLKESLRELNNAYQTMLDRQKELLSQAFNVDMKLSLAELRKIVSVNCHGLENYTVDSQGLRAFVMHVTKNTGSDNDWLKNVLMFLGHKPSDKWLDSDQDTAEYRLNDLTRRIIDLEKLRLHEKDCTAKIDGDFDVYLLRSVKKGEGFLDEVVAVDPKSSSALSEVRDSIEKVLTGLPDEELRLAVLAETVDSFLRTYRQSKETKTPTNNSSESLKGVSNE